MRRATQAIRAFDTWVPRMLITSSLGHLGDRANAEQARVELEKHRPRFSIAQARRDYVVLVSDEQSLERMLTGLRKAGVPES